MKVRKETQDEFRARVRLLVAKELCVETARVTDDATFSDLGADSLDVVSVVMTLEHEFQLEISDEDAEKIHTFRDVIAYIERAKA